MKLSTSQRLMHDDGLPVKLFLTPEQRAKAWAGRTLTHIPFIAASKTRDESAETAAFRAQVEEQRRLKSLAGIARMKTRFAAKAIDYTKVRWDARRAKFVPIGFSINATDNRSADTERKLVPTKSPSRAAVVEDAPPRSAREVAETAATPFSKRLEQEDWSRINAACAPIVAKRNGVWDPKYEKLKAGLLVMTVTNRLKGLIKRGGTVKWQ